MTKSLRVVDLERLREKLSHDTWARLIIDAHLKEDAARDEQLQYFIETGPATDVMVNFLRTQEKNLAESARLRERIKELETFRNGENNEWWMAEAARLREELEAQRDRAWEATSAVIRYQDENARLRKDYNEMKQAHDFDCSRAREAEISLAGLREAVRFLANGPITPSWLQSALIKLIEEKT